MRGWMEQVDSRIYQQQDGEGVSLGRMVVIAWMEVGGRETRVHCGGGRYSEMDKVDSKMYQHGGGVVSLGGVVKQQKI